MWLAVGFTVSLVAATPLAYFGTLWLDAWQRGWRTQVAAGALIAGWMAVALGAASVWNAVRKAERPNLFVPAVSFIVAFAAYAVAYNWGGRMLT
jgi:hypothetical protein